MSRRRNSVLVSRSCWLALTLLLPALSCAKKQSQLVVGIATDLNAPAPLSRIHLQVFELDAQGNLTNGGVALPDETFDISGTPDKPYELPGSYSLLADGEPRVKIVLTASTSDGREMVRRTAILQLEQGTTRFLRMGVVAACMNNSDCAEGHSCVEGICQDAHVAIKALPEYQTDMEKKVACSSGTAFLSTSHHMPVAMAGAGTCAADEYCVEGTCRKAAVAGGAYDWETELAHAICSLWIRCGISSLDENGCVAVELVKDAQDLANLSEGVRTGRIRFNEDKARACFQAARNSACSRSDKNSFQKSLFDCLTVFAGTLPEGGACVEDLECGGSDCRKNCSGSDACCLGTCGPSSGPLPTMLPPPMGLGASCFDDSGCVQGGCSGGTCRNLVPTGGACTSAEECDGLADACIDSKCTPPARVGQACNGFSYVCAEGTDCRGTDGARTCQALRKINESCTSDSDCLVGRCVAGSSGSVCRVSNMAVAPCRGGTTGAADAGVDATVAGDVFPAPTPDAGLAADRPPSDSPDTAAGDGCDYKTCNKCCVAGKCVDSLTDTTCSTGTYTNGSYCMNCADTGQACRATVGGNNRCCIPAGRDAPIAFSCQGTQQFYGCCGGTFTCKPSPAVGAVCN
jgi:hypothetical protein